MSQLNRIIGGERRNGTTLSDFINMGNERKWMDDAACRETDPDLFYPESAVANKDAKKVCQTCSVVTQCLEYALDHPEEWGIWGGTSQEERKVMRRRGRVA